MTHSRLIRFPFSSPSSMDDPPLFHLNPPLLRTDVYTSIGVMAGLALILPGERIFPGVYFDRIDPVAAIEGLSIAGKSVEKFLARAVQVLEANSPIPAVICPIAFQWLAGIKKIELSTLS